MTNSLHGDNYYVRTPVARDSADWSIYEVWENGGSFGDSVTPSTWCPDYREMMVQKLTRHLGPADGQRILSLGCGNAFVEADLARLGYDVLAVDINEKAVELARSKGVRAERADFFEFAPSDGEPFDLVYADGFFGHLYREDTGCTHVMKKIKELLRSDSGMVVISNDGPQDGSLVQAHRTVPDFFYLANEFLEQQAEAQGLQPFEVTKYVYERPLSGPRPRSIVTARRLCVKPLETQTLPAAAAG